MFRENWSVFDMRGFAVMVVLALCATLGCSQVRRDVVPVGDPHDVYLQSIDVPGVLTGRPIVTAVACRSLVDEESLLGSYAYGDGTRYLVTLELQPSARFSMTYSNGLGVQRNWTGSWTLKASGDRWHIAFQNRAGAQYPVPPCFSQLQVIRCGPHLHLIRRDGLDVLRSSGPSQVTCFWHALRE